jgi:hypothetical protein
MRLASPLSLAARLLPRRVGVSIESASLRAVLLRGGAVRSWGEEPFDHRLVGPCSIADAQSLGFLLGALLRKLGGMGSAAIAIPLWEGDLRALQPPAESDPATAIPELLLGREARGRHVGWARLASKDGRFRALAASVPLETARGVGIAAAAGGATLRALALRPLAAYRASSLRNGLLCHLDGPTLEVLAVRADEPVLATASEVGQRDDDGSAAVDPDAIVQAVERALRAATVSGPLACDAVVFTGDRFAHLGARAAIERLCGAKLLPFEPLARCPAEFPAGRYAAALGAALQRA